MKKFTKGCLITALILFVFGCAFWGICGYMGGFRQLDNLNISRDRFFSIGWNGIRWGFNGNWFGIWDDDYDDDRWPKSAGTPSLVEVGDKVKTDYHALEITDIDIELGGNNLIIEESDDEYIWIANNSNVKTVKYALKNGVFKLYYGNTVNNWNDIAKNSNICLYLPEGMNLNTIDIEMGAVNMESIVLTANEIDMEIGAGNFNIEGLLSDEVNISVGAGNAEIENLDAGEVSMEVGAGEIVVDDMTVKNLDLECGAGNVNLTLAGDVTDYNYQVESAMGNIRIGDNKYTGIIGERNINNGSSRKIDVECAMGNIEIDFVK